MIDDDDCESALCALGGDPRGNPTREEINRMMTYARRVHLVPIRRELGEQSETLARLEKAIFDPKIGLESIRWWVCRGIWVATAIGAGLMGFAKFLHDMGWW